MMNPNKEVAVKLALLNTTVATTDGRYLVETVPLDEARRLVYAATGWDSAIGHASTAEIMTTLLGVEVPVVRQQFEQQPGQQARVFKLKGRPEEGKILSTSEIEAIDYEFKIMTREK